MSSPNCYECKYRGNLPGSAHSRCNYPGTSTNMFDFFNPKNKVIAKELHIIGDFHGINMGWFMWPLNYDPVWLKNCDGFVAKEVTKL